MGSPAIAARVLLVLTAGAAAARAACPDDPDCPSTANCSTLYYNQTIDHFNWGAPAFNPPQYAFKQRYYVYDEYFKPGGPIFFYFGNEDNVGLYVNHTGLMWENAAEFGAKLVFAEHRFYGASMPFPAGTEGCLGWLTTEQAMADFAELIDHLKHTDPALKKAAVVGFGGSYGGMIGAWFRIKYPNSVDGVVAASAPIWSFVDLDPPYNYQAFAEGVTHDMTTAAGANTHCKVNLHKAYGAMQKAGQTAAGRATLSAAFKTCHPLETSADVGDLISWAQGPFANMAMGNYPYPSTYLMHGKSFLPAWPMREACKALDLPGLEGPALFAAVRAALAVQLNNTGAAACFYNADEAEMRASLAAGETLEQAFGERVVLPGRRMGEWQHVRRHERAEGRRRGLAGAATIDPGTCAGDWGMQWCTEMNQPFQYGCDDAEPLFPEDGLPADFHYGCSRFDQTYSTLHCKEQWGFEPRYHWARFGLGGKQIKDASNIVFSNGLYDPWHGGGVLSNLSATLLAVVIPHGAHHLDLMFSNPLDPPDVLAARATEKAEMRRWVAEANAKNGNTLGQALGF